MNRLELTDYADRYLIDRLATVPGVAQVGSGGEQRYAMRIWLERRTPWPRAGHRDDVETALNDPERRTAGRLAGGADQGLHHPRRAHLRDRAEDFERMPADPSDGRSSSGRVPRRRRRPASVAGAASGVRQTGHHHQRASRLRHPPGRHRPRRGSGQRRPPPVPGQRRGPDRPGVTRQAQSNDLADLRRRQRSSGGHATRACPRARNWSWRRTIRSSPPTRFEEVWITIGISLGLVALVNFIFLGSLARRPDPLDRGPDLHRCRPSSCWPRWASR
jgi:multidrug efflux pump